MREFRESCRRIVQDIKGEKGMEGILKVDCCGVENGKLIKERLKVWTRGVYRKMKENSKGYQRRKRDGRHIAGGL